MRSPIGGLGLAAALALSASAAAGQAPLDARVAPVRDGVVRFSFRARDGVCGNGRNINFSENRSEYWEGECDHGPVRVVLLREQGRTVKLETYVGGRWRSRSDAVDLGTVGSSAASRYLMALVRTGSPEVGRDAIMPAQLADSVEIWPELLDVARDDAVPDETRKAAVFWVGQAASRKAVEGLEALVDDDTADLALRERAVFSLSQQRDAQAVPALIRLAKEHPNPRIRQRALFWLGQRDDPRVLDLFREILSGSSR